MPCSKILNPDDNVLLFDGDKCKLISLREVRFFETCGNYSKAYFSTGMLMIHRSLNYLESRLPTDYFFRANRQFIINLSHVNKIQTNKQSGFRLVMSCGTEVDISRRRSQQFRDSLIL